MLFIRVPVIFYPATLNFYHICTLNLINTTVLYYGVYERLWLNHCKTYFLFNYLSLLVHLVCVLK